MRLRLTSTAPLSHGLLQAIPLIDIVLELDNDPCPLTHPDLNAANLLFDNEYNSPALLDWTAIQTLPWQSLLSFHISSSIRPTYLEQRIIFCGCFEEAKREEYPLTNMMRRLRCEITELIECFYRWAKVPDGCASRLALKYGETMEWEDLKKMYLESVEIVRN